MKKTTKQLNSDMKKIYSLYAIYASEMNWDAIVGLAQIYPDWFTDDDIPEPLDALYAYGVETVHMNGYYWDIRPGRFYNSIKCQGVDMGWLTLKGVFIPLDENTVIWNRDGKGRDLCVLKVSDGLNNLFPTHHDDDNDLEDILFEDDIEF